MGHEVAWLLQPALFLHFVLTFPERRAFVGRHRWSIPALYVPGVVLFVIQFLALEYLKASNSLLFNLNRVHWAYLTIFFVSQRPSFGTTRARHHPHSAQQLKWITRALFLP